MCFYIDRFPAGQVIQKSNIYASNYAGAWHGAQCYHILMKVSRYDREKKSNFGFGGFTCIHERTTPPNWTTDTLILLNSCFLTASTVCVSRSRASQNRHNALELHWRYSGVSVTTLPHFNPHCSNHTRPKEAT